MTLTIDLDNTDTLTIILGGSDHAPHTTHTLTLSPNPEIALRQIRKLLTQQRAAQGDLDKRLGTPHAPTQQMMEHLANDTRWTMAKPHATKCKATPGCRPNLEDSGL